MNQIIEFIAGLILFFGMTVGGVYTVGNVIFEQSSHWTTPNAILFIALFIMLYVIFFIGNKIMGSSFLGFI